MMRSWIVRAAAIAIGCGVTLPSVGDANGGKFSFSAEEVGEVIGEVQKPDVIVLISRENLNKAYELELTESFLDKIIESVEHPPF